VWAENKRLQIERKGRSESWPLFMIFKAPVPPSTRSPPCAWDGGGLLRLLLDLGAVLDLPARKNCTGTPAPWWRRRCSGPTSWFFGPAAPCGAGVADKWGQAGPAIIVPCILAHPS